MTDPDHNDELTTAYMLGRHDGRKDAERGQALLAPSGSALRPMTLHTLRACRDRMKQEALSVGRYGPLYTPENYDKRDKSKAFRCISYVDHVRWINALEEVISFFEQNK